MSNWNNQQQYSNYHQHTPGVQQPQWQAPPRKGWGDPRLQQQNQSTSLYAANTSGHTPGQQWQTPPPPVPQSEQPSYAPNNDTSSWGVRYNQQQQQQPPHSELRPALPPRPPSAIGNDYGGWDGRPPQNQKPPTPPPRPPQYATPPQPAQGHYYPHDQYSNRPSSHHYDPAPPQNWSQPPPPYAQQQQHQQQQQPSAPSWHHLEGPVSPIEPDYNRWSQHPPSQTPAPAQKPPSQQHYQAPPPQRVTTPLGASALGTGTPSDWQQLQSTESYYDSHPQQQQQQTQQQQQQQQQPQQVQQQSQQPQQQQQAPPRRASAFTATPEQIHASPAQTSQSKPQQLPQGPYSHQNTTHSQWSGQGAVQGAVAGAAAAAGRQRVGSESSTGSFGPPERSGTIDSVIQAWNAPPQSSTQVKQTKAPTENLATSSSTETATALTQTDVLPPTKVETKIETRETDPYSDLKEHYRTSLDRYASMLRQEANATTEQEKMKVIVGFINREIKLRSVLYGTEAAELVSSAELSKLRADAAEAKQQQPLTISPPSHGAANHAPSAQPRSTGSPILKDDSFVMVDKNDDDPEFSPGGRPLLTPLKPKAQSQAQPFLPNTQNSSSLVTVTDPPSPASNAPMVLEDYAMPDTGSNHEISRPPSAAPQAPAQKTEAPVHINFQPPRPAYTPFKYVQPEDVPQTTVTPANPADQAYTKLRHEQAFDSGRILGQETPSVLITPSPDRSQNATPSTRAKQQQQAAFIGLLRHHSNAGRSSPNTGLPNAPEPLRAGTPFRGPASTTPLVRATDSVKALLPAQLPPASNPKSPHPRLAPIFTASSALNNDFSFIHATVLEWDKENRKHRTQLDKDRADRESENQARTDQLFHDNEIGYADIAGIEEEFKLDEASKKYQEDQAELESFTRSVFDKVTQKLESEVAQLEKLHSQTLTILDSDSVSASGRIKLALGYDSHATDKLPLADVMDLLLSLYNKIEIRETKLAEARFERERRRKRLELTVLYANGDTPGVKKLEREFDKAQSMQVLAEAKKKDERANKLMDSFDRAVVGGLSDNQAWIDDVSNKVSLLRDLVLGSEANGPQGTDREELLYGDHGIRDTMKAVASAVNLVMQDSRDLVTMSNQADKILNEADFAMFLAEAKIADADDSEFKKLKNEKDKEDSKLRAEFENRMNGINHGPEEILSFVKDVRDYIGPDPNHQARIAEALEAAKKRNEAGPT